MKKMRPRQNAHPHLATRSLGYVAEGVWGRIFAKRSEMKGGGDVGCYTKVLCISTVGMPLSRYSLNSFDGQITLKYLEP